MMSRLVTSIATLCLLALGAGAAAIAAIAWPERQLEATFVSASLLALTIAFARRLQQSLTQSIDQISQTLTRLAKGDLDATVPEVGSIDELRRMSRQFGEFVGEVTRILTSVRSAANALVA